MAIIAQVTAFELRKDVYIGLRSYATFTAPKDRVA